MRSDTAFLSGSDISRRFLAGLASDLLSAAGAAFAGGDARRALERTAGAGGRRICSTSLNALISAWRRSISLWRSAIACAMALMAMAISLRCARLSTTARQGCPLPAGGTSHECQRPRRRRRMASTRPPRTYSPSARAGRRRGGSTGVARMVRLAGSDGLPGSPRSTDPVDRSAASIRRRNRPNTAFKLRGRSDMQARASITHRRSTSPESVIHFSEIRSTARRRRRVRGNAHGTARERPVRMLRRPD